MISRRATVGDSYAGMRACVLLFDKLPIYRHDHLAFDAQLKRSITDRFAQDAQMPIDRSGTDPTQIAKPSTGREIRTITD